MKKIVTSLLVIILFLMLMTITSQAAGMSVTVNKSSATVGDSFTVTISGIYGDVSISGNSNITLSTSGRQFVDGSLTISGIAKSAGTGTVTVLINDAVTTGADPQEVSGSKSVSITVKEKEKEKEVQTPVTTPNNSSNTTQTKSSNNDLKTLEVSEGELTPGFDKNLTEYSLSVGHLVDKINVNAVPEDSKATVNITGNTELQTGENVINIEVKAEDSKTKTYKIIVTKQERVEPILEILELIGIKEDGNITLELNPKFGPNVFSYTLDIPKEISNIEINAISIVPDALVTISGNEELQDGENLITITIKLSEEEQVLVYSIKANKIVVEIAKTTDYKDSWMPEWLTIEIRKILITVLTSIICIMGVAFGIIEYRDTKNNPTFEEKQRNRKREERNRKRRLMQEGKRLAQREDIKEEKNVERHGKHF